MSSAAAAVVVHEVWRAGAIVGAAVTPVLMALFAEALRRPVERMTARTSPPLPGETMRIYRSRPRWLRAVGTGLVAFVLGAAGLTVAEALLQRSVADSRAGTTLFDRRPPPQPTGSLELFEKLMPNAEAALAWLDADGDLDGDGLIEYLRRAPGGLDN